GTIEKAQRTSPNPDSHASLAPSTRAFRSLLPALGRCERGLAVDSGQRNAAGPKTFPASAHRRARGRELVADRRINPLAMPGVELLKRDLIPLAELQHQLLVHHRAAGLGEGGHGFATAPGSSSKKTSYQRACFHLR